MTGSTLRRFVCGGFAAAGLLALAGAGAGCTAAQAAEVAALGAPGQAEDGVPCRFDEAMPRTKSGVCTLHGKVKIVDSFPKYKVKIVDSFPDIKVQRVSSFADGPGKWQFVDSFPDFTIQLVDSFPDFTVQYVSSFPGCD